MSSTDRVELDGESAQAVEKEIRDLEEQLARAKGRLKAQKTVVLRGTPHNDGWNGAHQPAMVTSIARGKPFLPTWPSPVTDSFQAPLQNETTHFLLLLADSALPLGSFAFSSGLESYLAHARLNPVPPFSSAPSPPPPPNAAAAGTSAQSHRTTSAPVPSFDLFLPLSIASYASTTLPFLLAAHRSPARLAELDDALDAAIVCTVGKRASVAQGRALLGLWEKSFSPEPPAPAQPAPPPSSSSSRAPPAPPPAHASLASYARLLRAPAVAWDASGLPPVAAHLAPLFGAVASALGLGLAQAAYVFVLGHVRALVSAAVRASVMGPYAAQRVLASPGTRAAIQRAIDAEWDTAPEAAGQAVPAMDLWVGRHELLYSRIFNS